MIALDELTDEQFERHALDVLRRELGADHLARFLAPASLYQRRGSRSANLLQSIALVGDPSIHGIGRQVDLTGPTRRRHT